jgi:hypothetical protein
MRKLYGIDREEDDHQPKSESKTVEAYSQSPADTKSDDGYRCFSSKLPVLASTNKARISLDQTRDNIGASTNRFDSHNLLPRIHHNVDAGQQMLPQIHQGINADRTGEIEIDGYDDEKQEDKLVRFEASSDWEKEVDDLVDWSKGLELHDDTLPP